MKDIFTARKAKEALRKARWDWLIANGFTTGMSPRWFLRRHPEAPYTESGLYRVRENMKEQEKWQKEQSERIEMSILNMKSTETDAKIKPSR